MTAEDGAARRLARGDPAYRQLATALFAAGMASITLLYTPQPLLPELQRAFGVSPTAASLPLAVATAGLGLALLPAGWLSDAVGRTPVLTSSLVLASVLALLCSAAPSLAVLCVLRALEGIALAGVPAVAMTYLAEEMSPSALGGAVGLYVASNAIGGMGGRLVAGALCDVGGWRLGFAGCAAVGVTCTVVCWHLLPRSRNFRRRPFAVRALRSRLAEHLTEPGLLRLNAIGALLMGVFVAVYNGLAFRLAAPPYGLDQTALAAVFLVYSLGSLSSAVAGRAADRFGRRRVLPVGVVIAAIGLALTVASSLAVIVAGIAVLTVGFFASHSTAASWVGRRAAAAPGQASALYLLAYYTGASLAGPLAGTAWTAGAWTGVLVLTGTLLLGALAVSLRLRVTPSLPPAVG